MTYPISTNVTYKQTVPISTIIIMTKISVSFETFSCVIVFVKDASLYFTKCGHERRRREIAITSAKYEAERSESNTASEGAIYKT